MIRRSSFFRILPAVAARGASAAGACPGRSVILAAALLACMIAAVPARAQEASAPTPAPSDSSSPPVPPSKGGFWWALGQTTPAGAVDPGTPYGNWWKQLWGGQKLIRADGGYDVFLSGYAWHPPTSYDEDKKEDLNEKAWGTGIGRTMSAANGQQRAFYLFVSEDSHNDPQVMLGYSWLARTPSAAGLRLGAGYTIMMIGRDEFGYLPVPFATPLFTLDVGPVQTILSYVPKYDVWYIFGRIAVRGQRSVRAANPPPEDSRVASRAAR